MKKYKLIVLLIIMGSGTVSFAQRTVTDTASKKPQLKELFVNAGLQYISNLTYAGRRDDSSVPLLLPTLTLVSKHGFFLSAIGYFDLNGSKSGAEGLSITPGYVFGFDSKKYYGGTISATKFFITGSSPIILSSFNATIDGSLYANPDNIVKLSIGGSYRFDKNNKNDIINTAELSKEIFAVKTGATKLNGLKLTPTASLYAGTQSFYQTYYTESQVTRSVETPQKQTPINILFPNQPKQTIITQTVTQENQKEVRKYQLLAFSGSIPVTYVINKVQIVFTPYLIKPFNQVDYVSNTSKNGLYFLFSAGASVTF
ncbi:hypothetical protein PQ469_28450 [Mucilaginibacter sp. KACC 22773]|uniref:hypothetical protein n=1 Tax=Mucilaginibacter sp. KACC 22773 TaxID=3025671 RepID=UPI0023661D91|nr:hypothetical protein [Mucilaginibacter sp. KACC 22773]WDF77822.1 hypothetical protein PQ469_28450 [Mucilaginibacter sp. KACC 22773]